MKFIFSITGVLTIVIFLFGTVKANGVEIGNLPYRFLLSFIGSFIVTLILALPICGILYLIGK